MSHVNILLIHSDQHRFDCLGINGHPFLRTPNLDKLAAQGVSFTHAFTACPACVPARNSLLYGVWPGEHGAITNWGTEAAHASEPGLPSFSQTLRDAGYYLGYVGKWGVHPKRTPLDYGFHEYVAEGEYQKWRAAKGLPPLPRTNGWFGEVDPHIGPEHSRMAWGADHTIYMLAKCANSREPFFIRWDPSGPHLPNIVPEPYASMYPPAQIPPWPSFPDPLLGKPYIQAQQRRTWKIEGWTWTDWAAIVSRYLGEISLMDAQIGRVLTALAQLGLDRNTLVIYTSDHGDLCGGHGMIDKHFVMYDDVVRVPLIVRCPGCTPEGQRCDAFISSNIDLATTFCAVAGLSPPPTFRGHSLLPLLSGEGSRHEDIFSVYYGSQFGLYSQRMVRDRRWKYVWNATAEDELYDLELDAGELRNLAGNTIYRGELARLRQRLIGWMEETHDCLLNQWTRAVLLEGLK
ncbi:MAG: sulfatase-like hydrolase/transferase [Anaerolineae bacterium]